MGDVAIAHGRLGFIRNASGSLRTIILAECRQEEAPAGYSFPDRGCPWGAGRRDHQGRPGQRAWSHSYPDRGYLADQAIRARPEDHREAPECRSFPVQGFPSWEGRQDQQDHRRPELEQRQVGLEAHLHRTRL